MQVRLREAVLAALFYLLATIVFTWPIAAHVGDGLADIWDAKLNAWILHWDFHQTFSDPVHLYDANIFYPDRYALAFSENLFGAALFAFPFYTAGISTLGVYNIVFLLGMFLSAMAAWALARETTGDPLAASAAGVIYAFCPWRIAQIPHIQFQWGAFLALALLFLLRWLDRGRLRDLIVFSICFAWNALCNVHYALFSGFLVVVVLAWEGLAAGWRTFRQRLFGALGAMAAAAAIVFPLLASYAIASKLYGMQRGTDEIGVFSGVWTDFLTAGGQNKLYAPLTQKWAKAEGELFPGLVALALAVVAVVRRRAVGEPPEAVKASPRRRRIVRVLDALLFVNLAAWAVSLLGVRAVGPLKMRESGRVVVPLTLLALLRLIAAFPQRSPFADLGDFLRRTSIGSRRVLFLAIAAAGVVIALGTHTPYYRFLVQSFGPVFHVIRAPVRGIVLFDLGLAVLAAWGLAELTRGRKPAGRGLAVLAALIAIGFEYRAFPLDVTPVDPEPAPVYRWLARAPISGGVVEWPLGNWYDQEYEFRSTAHWKPLVNGASGFSPRDYDEMAATMDRKPIPDEAWMLLAQRRTSLLVYHPEAVNPEAAAAYADAVKRGVQSGRIVLLRSFPHGGSRDFVFRLGSASTAALPEASGPEKARLDQAFLELVLHPPFGYIDTPAEGQTVEPGAWAFGWALDDSGVARVRVSADGGPAIPVVVGQPYPGVENVYPGFPDAVRPGFGFAIPALPPGPHTLTITIIARDGGQTELKRSIEVRSSRMPTPPGAGR
jgi:hypothetical protein